jgi:hypothetical protein
MKDIKHNQVWETQDGERGSIVSNVVNPLGETCHQILWHNGHMNYTSWITEKDMKDWKLIKEAQR